MLNITPEVRDEVTPLLRRLHAQTAHGQRRPLMATAGKALERALRKHFAARDNDTTTARARKGWPKQHFWRRIRDNTNLAAVTSDSATVRIASRPFRQKLFGGTIRPGPGKRALAIPMTAETYGKRASSNPIAGGLFVWKSPKTGKAFLAGQDEGAHTMRLKLYYRLIRSVRQQPDPKALPPQATTARTIDAALQRWANRHLK